MMALITGGSGSGKSDYAENLAVRLGDGEKYYIATMQRSSAEDDARIARHREMRKGKGFLTIECPRALPQVAIAQGATVLLECMSNLLANELYGGDADSIMLGIDGLRAQCRHLIVVTNEVFSDGVRYDLETMRYIKLLGQINRALAMRADYVCEVVYSIPVILKGAEPCAGSTD